jgi:hypothetical protein
MGQIRSLFLTETRAYQGRSLPAQLAGALIIAVLCFVAGVLLCATMIFLALHTIVPTLAPVNSSERVGVWYRFSRLAIQEVRSRY